MFFLQLLKAESDEGARFMTSTQHMVHKWHFKNNFIHLGIRFRLGCQHPVETSTRHVVYIVLQNVHTDTLRENLVILVFLVPESDGGGSKALVNINNDRSLFLNNPNGSYL